MAKCEICSKKISETFLRKILGTYIKDSKGKKHVICFECQKKFPKKEDLRKNFLNKFIAIKRGEVIASGNSIEEVNKILERKNIDPAKTVIEFVPEEEGIMVL